MFDEPLNYPLRWVCSNPRYATYLDRYVDEVYLANERLATRGAPDVLGFYLYHAPAGERRRLFPVEQIDLPDLFASVEYDRSLFYRTLHERLVDPSAAEAVTICERCSDPEPTNENMHATRTEGFALTPLYVCDPCFDAYYTRCGDCSLAVHVDYSYSVLGDESVCRSCRESHYLWCNECEGYYHYNDSDRHEHVCGCEAPAQSFGLRNGEEVLVNDQIVTVTMAKGTISDDGLYQIQRLLFDASRNTEYWVSDGSDIDGVMGFKNNMRWLAAHMSDLGNLWQDKGGNYTKRLRALAYKQLDGFKIPDALLAQIGNVARENSGEVSVEVAITRDLNQSPEDFANEESCWWTDYARSRCALKSNGGFGLRAFGEEGGWGISVEGRAWVMALKRNERGVLRPTFDTLGADAFVIFNGYGTLEGITAARVLGAMTGWKYKRIAFGCDPMYINSGSGYLVSEDSDTEVESLNLNLKMHADLYEDEQRAEAETTPTTTTADGRFTIEIHGNPVEISTIDIEETSNV